jgi:endonuclease/exonuclease/phosphatase family metal-dependent hydrolase
LPSTSRHFFQRDVLTAIVLVALSACLTATPARADVSFLAKASPDLVRVMTWNVGRDSMFPDAPSGHSRHEQFARVIRALDPDIVCLQEVWLGSQRAAALFDTIAPLPDRRRWQHHGVLDNVILSRADLIRREADTLEVGEGRQRGHAMALANTAAGTDVPAIYVICGHFHSGGGERVVQRERQADMVAGKIYALQASGGLSPRTPIVVLGDLNAIASVPAHFVADLRAGRIHDTPAPGGRAPDWDGSELEDVLPRHNGRGEDTWTWRQDASGFPPGALDRVLYTGSVLEAGRAFVLDTTTMSLDELRAAGLEREDVMLRASEGMHDHLPLVVDFGRVRGPAATPPAR